MGELTEPTALRLIGAYGEPFLRYVFALSEDKPIIEAVQSTNTELVLLLQSVLDQASYDAGGNSGFPARGNFGVYRPELGGSLANYVRRLAGGAQAKAPTATDPLARVISEIAADAWPTLLLPPPKQGPRTFWISSSLDVLTHPRTVEACKEFMADQNLASLFPGAPSIEDATELGDVLHVHANWILNSGHGGGRQLVSLIDAVIINAAIVAQLDGSLLNQDRLMAAIPQSVDFFRKLATNKPVAVPAIIGFCGLQVTDGEGLKFGDSELRPIRPVEKDLLLNEADRITSVFATQFSVQLLDTSPIKPDDEPDSFLRTWSKYNARIQESHQTLQRRIDRIRLSVLLASEGSEYLAMGEVARYIADPTQPGGVSSWQMEQRSPPSYPLKKGQSEETSRLYGVIQEKHPESLDIAMKRILSAVSQRWDATDAFIDAVVVWENAFGTTAETTFRVTGAIAKLLQLDSADERGKLQKELKGLYEARSRLVHGAKEPKPEDAWSQRERAIAVALEVLRKLYTERPDLLKLNSELRGARLLLEG